MSPAARKTVSSSSATVDWRSPTTDKVLYPETGTTKGRVIEYYERVAPWMIPHEKDRPVTRNRWANGVEGTVFFEKNLPDSAPDWVRHHTIHHAEHDNEYPIVDDLPTLVGWRSRPHWSCTCRSGGSVPEAGSRTRTRLVLDLDPGEGVACPSASRSPSPRARSCTAWGSTRTR